MRRLHNPETRRLLACLAALLRIASAVDAQTSARFQM